MGLWDKLKNELVDIVEWLDSTKDTMVWRFPRYQNEIKYGAQLVVRESQAAVFVNMGKIADVYMPGMYTLDTKNMPILATLMGWKYGFNSPFKCEVYFVSTRQFTDLKWGTMNPIMLRDPEFGPMRLRAFGTYAMRAKDPAAFVRQIAGTNAAAQFLIIAGVSTVLVAAAVVVAGVLQLNWLTQMPGATLEARLLNSLAYRDRKVVCYRAGIVLLLLGLAMYVGAIAIMLANPHANVPPPVFR